MTEATVHKILGYVCIVLAIIFIGLLVKFIRECQQTKVCQHNQVMECGHGLFVCCHCDETLEG